MQRDRKQLVTEKLKSMEEEKREAIKCSRAETAGIMGQLGKQCGQEADLERNMRDISQISKWGGVYDILPCTECAFLIAPPNMPCLVQLWDKDQVVQTRHTAESFSVYSAPSQRQHWVSDRDGVYRQRSPLTRLSFVFGTHGAEVFTHRIGCVESVVGRAVSWCQYVVDCRDTQRSLFWNSPGLYLDNNKQMRGHRPPTGRHPQSALPRLWLNKRTIAIGTRLHPLMADNARCRGKSHVTICGRMTGPVPGLTTCGFPAGALCLAEKFPTSCRTNARRKLSWARPVVVPDGVTSRYILLRKWISEALRGTPATLTSRQNAMRIRP
ncbi:hypothetical protein Bbelb_185180 [Branchiostoma belcheri]|nr:hypothetical protein Bbelb_185180 [Branchiostoma belcheri]